MRLPERAPAGPLAFRSIALLREEGLAEALGRQRAGRVPGARATFGAAAAKMPWLQAIRPIRRSKRPTLRNVFASCRYS